MQQLARQRLAQDQAAAEIGGQNFTAENAKGAENNGVGTSTGSATVTPMPLVTKADIPEPPKEAPNWLQGAAGQGTWLRELIRPDRTLLQRGGTALEGIGRGLGSLAQAAEGLVGSVTGALPSLGGGVGEGVSQYWKNLDLGDVIKGIGDQSGYMQAQIKKATQPERLKAIAEAQKKEGTLALRQSAAAVAKQTAADWLATGQDYSKKYREASGFFDRPLASTGSATDDAATWAEYQTRNMAYTGLATNDARQRAVSRILAGENPTTVMRGTMKPGADAYTDEIANWETQVQEYIDAQGRVVKMAALKQGATPQQADALEQQARDEAGKWINASGRIPGEEQPVVEMIGQAILDPLNLPGANALIETATKPIVTKALGVEKANKLARTVDVASAGSATGSEAAQTILTGMGERERALLKGLGKPGEVITKVREFTPTSKAKKLANITFTQIGQIINDAPDAQSAMQALTKFVTDPDSLMATFGVMPKNVYSNIARGVVGEEELKALAKLPSITKAEKFDPLKFMAEAYDTLYAKAKAVAGVKDVQGAQRWAQTAKEWMSEFYLRTPGYIVRNWASDNMIGTMDGLEMFDDIGRVRSRLEKYGVLTSRVQLADRITASAASTGSAAVELMGRESKLGKVPVVGKIQNKLGQIANKMEESRYLRAYDSALKQFRAANYAPKLSDATRAAFKAAGLDGMADALEAGWRQAGSAKDVRRVVGEVLNGNHAAAQVFVTKYGVSPLDISADWAVEIETKVRQIAARGGDVSEINGLIDRMINQTKARSASTLASMGTALQKPRATTAADAAADIADELRNAELNITRAVQHGEMTREEGQALLKAHEQGLMQQALERRQAVDELRAALGQVDPAAGDHVLASALHPVDQESIIRYDTRLKVDALRNAEWRKPPRERNWNTYFEETRRLWGEANNATVQNYKDATQALKEISASAGSATDILAKYKIRSLDNKAEELLAETRARIFEKNLNAPEVEADLEQFSNQLKADRVTWDAARNEARRYYIQMVRANPELAMEGADIWISAQRMVDVRFTQAVAKREELLGQLLGDKITLDEYRKLAGEEWGKAFRFATDHNGATTIERLRQLEKRTSIVAGHLREMGYKGDELTRLMKGWTDGTTQDEVRTIITEKRYPARKPVASTSSATESSATAQGTAGDVLTQALEKPPSADELINQYGGDMQAALNDAEGKLNAVGAVADFGMQDARAAVSGSRIPSNAEINKYLAYFSREGELKAGKLEDNLTELARIYGFTPNGDIPGGELESIRQWLEQAKQTRMQATSWSNPERKAAEDAYAAWDEIVNTIKDKMSFEAGASAADSAARDFVRQTIKKEGLAQGSATIRDITVGGTTQDALMLDELAQVAKRDALRILENTDDVTKAYASVEQTLADAVLGTRNIDEAAGITVISGDAAGEARALEDFRLKRNIPQVAGLELERSVSTIRALAKELNLNADELVRGERGIEQVIEDALLADYDKTIEVMRAPINSKGEITAKAWAEGNFTGERRKPGEILREIREPKPIIRHMGEPVEVYNRPPLKEETYTEWRKRVNNAYDSDGAGHAGVYFGTMTSAEYEAALKTGKFTPITGADLYITKDADRLAGGVLGDITPQEVIVEFDLRGEKVRQGVSSTAGTPEDAISEIPANNISRVWKKDATKGDFVLADVSELRETPQPSKGVEGIGSGGAGTENLTAETAKIAEVPSTSSGTATLEPGEMTGEQLAKADEAVEQAGGNFEPLGTEDMIAAAERKQIAALEQIRAGIGAEWEKVIDPKGVPKAVRQAMQEETQRMIREWYEFRNAAIYAAEKRANFSMLDYAEKRGGDTYMSMIAPYYYWGSRQARNFAIRLMQRPQILVQYQRYKDEMQKANEQRGLRGRFEGGIEIMPGVFLDPTAMIFPFASLVQSDNSPDDNRSALAAIYDAAGQIGVRPAPWVDIPLRMSGVLAGGAAPGSAADQQLQAAYGKGSIGSLLPQAGMIKGATALMGIGGPGGIDIERPIRQALGLPESQPYEPYIVARSVRDLSAERGVQPGQETPYLLAQALISNASDPTSGMTWGKLLSGEVTPDVISKQYATNTNMAQAALQIVIDAVNRAAQQKGISTLASGIAGQRVQVLPEGEQRFLDMQAQERAAAYNPATGQGSRAAVEQVRKENPTLAVGRAQYATLPGETTDANSIYQSSQRDAINAAFDALKDAVIATKPWDRDVTRTIEEQRSAALDSVSGASTGSATGWQAMYAQAVAAIKGTRVTTESVYHPRSLSGANPQERVQIRSDELMRYVSATRPTLAQFTPSTGSGGGFPDYDAYGEAVAKWEANLKQIAANSAQAKQVVAQAEAEGNGAALQEKLNNVTVQDVQEYWRRNDTPLEAAQRAWYELVYTPAMATAKQGTKVNMALLPHTGPTSAAELATMVQQMYGDRWTHEELMQALGNVSMPALADVTLENMSPKARESAQTAKAFNEEVRKKYGARGVKALQEYEQASGASAKAAVRKRYSILKRILEDRAAYGK